MTYSIVARDQETGALGVAVQSHFFGVGRLVTWAEPGVGAAATQSFVEVAYGPRGLELMRSGQSAPQALESLVARDTDAAIRQVAMVDAEGRVGSYTGQRCVPAAGSRRSGQACALGNMLAGPSCWEAMIDAFERASGELGERLLAALDAAEAEGGDIRGQQSAALLVVSGKRSESPWEEVLVDVRVDDHERPLDELRRLSAYDRAYRMLGGALFTTGVLTGTVQGAQIEEALRDLTAAQQVLGTNPEPTVWRGVLLARADRKKEAREDFEWAVRQRPQLAEFLRRLPAAGLLADDPAELEESNC